MKFYKIVFFGLLTLLSCSKDVKNDSIYNCSKNESTYINNNNTSLNLIIQDWYLKRNAIGGGSIKLLISGFTNGNSATIRNYGDGLIIDEEIALDSKNEFNKDVGISFRATSVPEGDLTAYTIIFVYRDLDTLEVELESCILRY